MPPRATATMILQKRDNMGFDIAPSLIIFLVILGAGAMVCCGFAIYRFYGNNVDDQSNRLIRSPEQDSYMREVRERAWSKLPTNAYGRSGQNLAHAPITPSGNSNSTYG